MSKRKKPLILILISEEWAFASHRLGMARYLCHQGFDVIVATKLYSDPAIYREEPFKILPLYAGRAAKNIFRDILFLFQLSALILRLKPDIVHAVSIKLAFLTSLILVFSKKLQLVNAFTGLGYLFTSGDIKAKLLKLLVSSLLRLMLKKPNYSSIVQNTDDQNLLKALISNKTHKIFLVRGVGVETKQFRFTDLPMNDPKLFLFPARLLRDKGIFEFVEAAELVHKRATNVRFAVAGRWDKNNPTAVSIEKMSEWQKLSYFEWHGHVDDIERLIAEAYAVCLPSYREGLPKSLLEAASCGRAVISTDVPGCKEICRHMVNGILVPPKQSMKLASAMLWLLDNCKEARKMGRNGRQIVEQEFSADEINAQIREIFNVLLNVAIPR